MSQGCSGIHSESKIKILNHLLTLIETTILKLPDLKLSHDNIKTWSSLSKEGFYILIDQHKNRISLPFCLFTKEQKRCEHFYSCSDRLENFIKGKDLRGKSLSEILRVYKEAWETIHLKGYCSCEGDLKKTFTKVLEDFKFLRTHKSVVNVNFINELLNFLFRKIFKVWIICSMS